ncbi:MAG TPA: CPBP family intramembrane glutamic endopeptidase [Kofleriaceae bacterium]|nr:CPBP family intramembrane glutamic endopeptidase [Kofleriaceae bacterium]
MERPEPPQSRATLVLGLYGALALLGLLLAAGRGDPDVYAPFDRAGWWHVASPVVGLVLGLLVVLASRQAVARLGWARALHRDFRALLGDVTSREIFILAAASAIGEEVLFRGALQPWIGLAPQAALFALLHVGPGRRFLPWTAWALAMGLAFGALVEITGDVGGAVVAHFSINYLNLHYIARVDLPALATRVGEPTS